MPAATTGITKCQVSASLLCLGREPGIDQAVTTDNPYLPLAQPVIVDYTLSALKNDSRLITRECSPVMMTKGMAAIVKKFLEQDDTSYLDDKGSLTVLCKINVGSSLRTHSQHC